MARVVECLPSKREALTTPDTDEDMEQQDLSHMTGRIRNGATTWENSHRKILSRNPN
jgi:hypothetical protein